MRSILVLACLLLSAISAAIAQPFEGQIKLRVQGFGVRVNTDDPASMVVRDRFDYKFFRRSGLAWNQTGSLRPAGGARLGGFSGETLALGATEADDAAINGGAVLLFHQVDGVWTETERLFASDVERDTRLGQAVFLRGDDLIASTSTGAVYVFKKISGVWTETQKITSGSGSRAELFGRSIGVSSDGQQLIVGAPYFDGPRRDTGAVYVYRRAPGDGPFALEQRIAESRPTSDYRFGTEVVIDGPFLGVRSSGSFAQLALYRRENDFWQRNQVLENVQGQVVLRGEDLVVGERIFSGFFGSIGYFRWVNDSRWSLQQRVGAFDGSNGDGFGQAVQLGDRGVLVGADRAVYDLIPEAVINQQPSADASRTSGGQACRNDEGGAFLNGTRSSDPDSTPGTNDDIVRFDWIENYARDGERLVATGELTQVPLVGGTYDLTLVVTDRVGMQSTDERLVRIDDRSPPMGEVLFPETGACYGADQLPIMIEENFEDSCDPDPALLFERAEFQVAKFGFGAAFGVRTVQSEDEIFTAAFFDSPGSVSVIREVDGLWTPVQKLQPDEEIGLGDTIAVDGGTLLLGASLAEENSGQAQVYARSSSGDWEVTQVLRPSDPAPDKYFGQASSIDGDLMAIGARLDDELVEDSGAVYLFEKMDGQWVETQKITSPEAQRGLFGTDVALQGDTLVIGAPNMTVDDFTRVGAGYVYERVGDQWQLVDRLLPEVLAPGFSFGNSVDIDGDTIVLGAPFDYLTTNEQTGAVYVFREQGGNWSQTARLEPARLSDDFAWAGLDVDLDGDRVLFGAEFGGIVPGSTSEPSYTGSAHLYRRGDSGWFEEAEFTSAAETSFGRFFGRFGNSVALRGDRVVVGAPLDDVLFSNSGAVYVFEGEDPRPVYDDHGTHAVKVVSQDSVGLRGFESVKFFIDTISPSLSIAASVGPLVVGEDLAYADLVQVSDEDGVTGGVVHERLFFDDCLLFDGDIDGDMDGVLQDEALDLSLARLCEALDRCGVSQFARPVVRAEAIDCGGNEGAESRRLELNVLVDTRLCAAGGS